MKERPIIFAADSVRAILEGRKAQTRRAVNPQPKVELFPFIGADNKPTGEFAFVDHPRVVSKHMRCPYGVPGDRLWVRESAAFQRDVDGEEPPYSDGRPIQRYDEECANSWLMPHYRATDPQPDLSCAHKGCESFDNLCQHPWRSPLHMPRWASRILLEITDIRVQLVQEITEEDAEGEGRGRVWGEGCFHRSFAGLWDSINAKRGYSWESNPWCWAITFKRLASAESRAA